MDVNAFLEPVQTFVEWLRTFRIHLYGFEFTFMDMFIFELLLFVVVWFLKSLIDGD